MMIRVGLFGVGLHTYWKQFDGLLNRLLQHQSEIKGLLASFGATVVDEGMIDTPQKAQAAGDHLRSECVDVIFLFVSTYALSSTVLPVVQKANVPVIVLNVQPVKALNYEKFNALNDRGLMTGVWLEHCQACSIPEIAGVFNRADIRYEIITGYLGDPELSSSLKSWVRAANVRTELNRSRLGILGHYYNGMLDVYSDVTRLSITFGIQMQLLEMCEVDEYHGEVTTGEIAGKLQEFNAAFDVSTECSQVELHRSARTSVAIDKLVEHHNLSALAYYYEGVDGNRYENIVTSVIAGNTLLTGKGIPVAGECEVKNAIAMKIMSDFGAGGSFSEFYAMDFEDDIVLLGHDGPAHFAIAEGRVGLVPLSVYHGKPGKGLSIQMAVKQGPVTLLSVVEGKDDIFLLVAEGNSVAGPTLQIGNTNSRYKFDLDVKTFINRWSKFGPAHHCAIGIGHIAGDIEKLGFLLGIRTERIC